MPPPEENPRLQPGRSAGEPPPAACSPTGPRGGSWGGSDSQFGWDEKVVLSPHFLPSGFQICMVRANMSLPRSPSMSSD